MRLWRSHGEVEQRQRLVARERRGDERGAAVHDTAGLPCQRLSKTVVNNAMLDTEYRGGLLSREGLLTKYTRRRIGHSGTIIGSSIER